MLDLSGFKRTFGWDPKWAAAFCLFTGAAVSLLVFYLVVFEGRVEKVLPQQEDAGPMPPKATQESMPAWVEKMPVTPGKGTSTQSPPAEAAVPNSIVKPAEPPPKAVDRPVVEPASKVPAKPDDELRAFLWGWKKSWENTAGQGGNIEAYLAFYSDDFAVRGYNKAAWKRDKAEKNKRKEWIRVELMDVKIGRAGRDNRMEVSFVQDYKSSDYSGTDKKTLVLKKEAAGWKILSERSE